MRSMIARFVILMLIAVLALPVATLPQPAESNHSPWGDVAVAAKGKKHKKKDKPKFTTVTRTVRQPVTQTFTSTVPIIVPVGAGSPRTAHAAPYPSSIEVSGFSNGVITDVNLTLTDLTNSYPEDVNVLLSTSDGRRALVMSGAGGSAGVTDIDLVLDDEAAAALPSGLLAQLASGTFRPTDTPVGSDVMDAPAPAPDGNVALSTFDGADPNGTWQVWVVDTESTEISDIGGGWALEITAEVDAGQVEEQVPVAKDKKHTKRKKQGNKRR